MTIPALAGLSKGAPRWRSHQFASPRRRSAPSATTRSATWTTRTRVCCASTSPTAGRSARAGLPVTAPGTSATSRPRSRTPARWRCSRTRARRAEGARQMSRTPMKLILTQEVSGLGAPGDVVDVAGGYGRNYLIPRNFAMHWTRGAEKQIELIKRARSAREIRGVEDAKAVAAQLEGLQVG